MAILEKEIWVRLVGKTWKHYEGLGYQIPRYTDKRGRLNIKQGTKILVKVVDLPTGSGEKVTKICDDCGEQSFNNEYKSLLKSREKGEGKDKCLKCANAYVKTKLKNNITYEKSLEYFALKNSKEHLLTEFSDKNNKSPKDISYGTREEYLWNCPDCKCEYPMKVNIRTACGSNCPFCSGTRVNHTNCLWTTHPALAGLLRNPQRGYEITAGRNSKEMFVCEKCGTEQVKNVKNVVQKGFPCIKCSDGLSYPEKFLMSVLDQLNIMFIKEKKFNWSNNKFYDFYIPSLDCIIETHGSQHYQISGFDTAGGRSLKEEQENDIYKMKLAKVNLISNYIVLDCRESNLEFIKKSILNSKLVELFNFENVNWNKCHSFSLTSLVKEACTLWDSGIESTVKISKILNVASGTVIRYLKQGAEIGWCKYDSQISSQKNRMDFKQRNKKKIVQLTLDGKYINTWNGMIEASNELGIIKEGISAACRGKNKTAGGFKWIYKEVYEKLLNSNE